MQSQAGMGAQCRILDCMAIPFSNCQFTKVNSQPIKCDVRIILLEQLIIRLESLDKLCPALGLQVLQPVGVLCGGEQKLSATVEGANLSLTLYTLMATIVAIWQFDIVTKFNSCSYTRLILRNIPHWIYLLEAIWCFFGHV